MILFEDMLTAAVVGSRDVNSLLEKWVVDYLTGIAFEFVPTKNLKVISGGARGVDTIAERSCVSLGIPFRSYPAYWAIYPRTAGAVRNQTIVDTADMMAAFWDERSSGSFDAMCRMIDARKPLVVHGVGGWGPIGCWRLEKVAGISGYKARRVAELDDETNEAGEFRLIGRDGKVRSISWILPF